VEAKTRWAYFGRVKDATPDVRLMTHADVERQLVTSSTLGWGEVVRLWDGANQCGPHDLNGRPI